MSGRDNAGLPPEAGDEWNGWFEYPPSRQPRLIPPIVLAYIGDAIYEVAVRQYLISKRNLKPNQLHHQAT